jgi:GNAT superfamily N-acetyltransferase
MTSEHKPIPHISIELLADHPHLIREVAEIRYQDWGQPEGPQDRAWWVAITTHEAGREQIPVTWVAIDDQGHALGCVALDEFDIEERHDRSPWVTGVIVETRHRSLGIGARLMEVLEAWAHEHGYLRAWVGTGGRAVDFYQKCGWVLEESFQRPDGEAVTILTKAL